MTGSSSDLIIIGGGIAGASLGYFAAASLRVVLLEQEEACGYHTTGRSAAMFDEGYGNAAIRAITAASRPFFEQPDTGFTENPLLIPRGTIRIASPADWPSLRASLPELRKTCPGMVEISIAEALALCPFIRPGQLAGALLDPGTQDIDTHALHQGFLAGLKRRGGKVITHARVETLRRGIGGWQATTAAGVFSAPAVVNAAGAWGDQIARMAGAKPVGLVPKRRTAFTFAPPAGLDLKGRPFSGLPVLMDGEEAFYLKPDAGNFLASPCDATPSEAMDAAPEELDVAIGIDRVEQATTLTVRRLVHKWAGLRTFTPDGTFALGFDPVLEGFFWCTGQGGYGMQTSPAMGMAGAALLTGTNWPAALSGRGIGPGALSPARFS